MKRTVEWAARCKAAHTRADQALFGIVQGGPHADLRARCADSLLEQDFDGYAIGGVSVGEGPSLVREALELTTHLLPVDRPRYLMGVGRPAGYPERRRHGDRPVRLRDADPERTQRNLFLGNGICPVAECVAPQATPGRSTRIVDVWRAANSAARILRHLFMAKEMLGPILATIHNLTYLHRLTSRIREAIAEGRFVQFRLEVLEALGA